MRKNVKAYQTINRESGLIASDPHTVITLLFGGVLESLSIAKGAIDRKDLEQKSTQLTKAINIIRSLQHSLDEKSEPKISDNFYQLYEYCIERLALVSSSLDISIIDEVVDLLKPLYEAWKNIPEADKQVGFELLKSKAKAG
jgi:flagellar protein FliS